MARVQHGTADNERLNGFDDPALGFDDLIYGFGADDFLVGGWGDDSLYGHSRADTLIGGIAGQATSGLDWLYGGSQNDLLFGLGSKARMYGGTTAMRWTTSSSATATPTY